MGEGRICSCRDIFVRGIQVRVFQALPREEREGRQVRRPYSCMHISPSSHCWAEETKMGQVEGGSETPPAVTAGSAVRPLVGLCSSTRLHRLLVMSGRRACAWLAVEGGCGGPPSRRSVGQSVSHLLAPRAYVVVDQNCQIDVTLDEWKGWAPGRPLVSPGGELEEVSEHGGGPVRDPDLEGATAGPFRSYFDITCAPTSCILEISSPCRPWNVEPSPPRN